MADVSSTEMLRKDHEDMQTVVAVLMEMSNRFEEDEAVSPADLGEVLRYLDTFVQRCHHAKEEVVLFPEIGQVAPEGQTGPIEIMNAEHQLEQNFLDGMREAIGRYAAGDERAGKTIAQYARDYGMLLARDMQQGDEIIYPLAEARLPQDKQELMARQMEDIEREVLGPQRHEPFHRMAHKLAEDYLN